MNIEKHLQNIARDFNLNLKPFSEFKYLILPPRQIIIRDFLGMCPDPVYVRYGNQDMGNIEDNLKKYLRSKEYKKELEIPQACIISKKELNQELRLINKIQNKELKKEAISFYNKIKKERGDSSKLTLVWEIDPRCGNHERRDEALLHEFVHELLEDNKIRLKSWKWNEGLVTYLVYSEIRKLYRMTEEIEPQSEMFYIYADYTKRWIKILEDIKEPTRRKQTILEKIKKVDKD